MFKKENKLAKILNKRVKKNKKESSQGFIIKFIKFSLISLGAMVLFSLGLYVYFSINLPNFSTLKDYQPKTITVVYSDDDRKIGEFYKQRRIVIPLSQMPGILKEAFIAAEDARFYEHPGIDLIGVLRAFIKNIQAGAIVQGGSTFTQQVVKNFLLTPERTFSRKIKELILAYRLEKKFTKEQILYMYFNEIYLGHGAYGVEAAAENYFGKKTMDLNLGECAMLAGLPQAPSRYSPFRHPERAKQRQIYVLNRMVAEKFINSTQATEAINIHLDIKSRRNWFLEKVPCYSEFSRRYVDDKYGDQALYEKGLKIYTAVNIEMQKVARAAVEKGLNALDKRQGYRGPIKTLTLEEIEDYSQKLQETFDDESFMVGNIVKGVVIDVDDENNYVTVRMGNFRGIIKIDDMKWARKPDTEATFYEAKIKHSGEALSIGDVIKVGIKGFLEDKKLKTLVTENQDITATENKEIDKGNVIYELNLEQIPLVQGALMCMDSETGLVKAMIGGRDFKDSQFNRAIQSKRQPGSAFKPIIYSAAIDKGYTPASMIIDSPIIIKGSEEDTSWRPKNYGEKFTGPTLFRKAFGVSNNVITVKILYDIGIDCVIEHAKKMGITSHLRREGGLALGSSGVSLLEMVKVYSVFSNSGYLDEPIFITKIIDKNGYVLEEASFQKKKAIEKTTAYIMTSLLETVVKGGNDWRGTGWKLMQLKRPVAGKTGTTNMQNDAWFLGFTPGLVTGVWVGHDSEAFLGKFETGSGAAAPIWIDFMKEVLEDRPVRAFAVPKGIVFAKIDADTGLLPIKESKNVLFECFKDGTVPKVYTKKHSTGIRSIISNKEESNTGGEFGIDPEEE